MKRSVIWLGISLGGLAVCALLVTIGATVGGAIYYLTARGATPPPRAWLQGAHGPLLRDWTQPEHPRRLWQQPVPQTGAPFAMLAGLRPVVVTEVISESPAEEAGLEPKDVIIAVDGRALSTGHDFSGMVRAHEPGDELELTIVRRSDGPHVLQVEISLGQNTDEHGQTVAYLGVSYRNLLSVVHSSPPSAGSWD
jgi:membrane-associated protease RseP (regulator of RpoE activity)